MILKKKNDKHFTNTKSGMKNTVINKIVVSNKIFFGKKSIKCFIGYKDDKRLDIYPHLSPQMSAYRRDFNDI